MEDFNIENTVELLDDPLKQIWQKLGEPQRRILWNDYMFQIQNEAVIYHKPSKYCPKLLNLKNKIIQELQSVICSSIFINPRDESENKCTLILWIFKRNNDFLTFFIRTNAMNTDSFMIHVYQRRYDELDIFNLDKRVKKRMNSEEIFKLVKQKLGELRQGLFIAHNGPARDELSMTSRGKFSDNGSSKGPFTQRARSREPQQRGRFESPSSPKEASESGRDSRRGITKGDPLESKKGALQKSQKKAKPNIPQKSQNGAKQNSSQKSQNGAKQNPPQIAGPTKKGKK